MKTLQKLGNWQNLLVVFLLLLQPVIAIAEPSGRGADYGDTISVSDALRYITIGTILAAIGGVFAIFRQRSNACNVLMWIFLVIGGVSLISGLWTIISVYALFPIFYALRFILTYAIVLAVLLLPYFLTYTSIMPPKNSEEKPSTLRIVLLVLAFLAILAAEIFLIALVYDTAFGRWAFPRWNFFEDFDYYKNSLGED